MSALHLIWICPLCATLGALWIGIFKGGGDDGEG